MNNTGAAEVPKVKATPKSARGTPVNAGALNLPRVAKVKCDGRDNCRPDGASFVALSRFTVAHMIDEVKQSFRQRPHRVDTANGFVRMEVFSPCDSPDEIWLITDWTDEFCYQTWHHSHSYQESHVGIPKGLKLVPNSVSIRFLEYVASLRGEALCHPRI